MDEEAVVSSHRGVLTLAAATAVTTSTSGPRPSFVPAHDFEHPLSIITATSKGTRKTAHCNAKESQHKGIVHVCALSHSPILLMSRFSSRTFNGCCVYDAKTPPEYKRGVLDKGGFCTLLSSYTHTTNIERDSSTRPSTVLQQ